VLKLAERAIRSAEVFVVMPFEDRGHLGDAYNTSRRVCKEKNFMAMKVDHHLDGHTRIAPAIFSKIKQSAFVIAEPRRLTPSMVRTSLLTHTHGADP
jgi:hypothetical protein